MKIKYQIIFLTLVKVSTCQQQFLSADVVQYINRQIDKLLQQNPPKDVLDLKINSEFNEQRKGLQNAKFKNPLNVTEEAEYQIDQKRRNFLKFAMEFEEVTQQLVAAFEEIENLQKNNLIPLSSKYKALTLKNRIHDSRTVREAQSYLKKYQHFKQNDLADSTNPYLALAQENKKYFEEIMKGLNTLFLYVNQTVGNGLQNLVEGSDESNNCAKKIERKLIEKNEDYEVYQIDGGDILEAFLGQ